MTRGRILYTGAFRFPDGDAAAARVLGIGKSLRELGYSVEYLGWEAEEQPADMAPDGRHRRDGFPYRSMKEFPTTTAASPVRRTLRHLSMGCRTLAWLRRADLTGVKAIIVYHGGVWFLESLRRFCRKRRIELLFDCTEWYDPGALPGGAFGPAAIDSELRMRWAYPRIGCGVVISRYLERHFKANGCRVARIPPTVDLSDSKWGLRAVNPGPRRPLRLVYAGLPGKKDLLQGILLGLDRLQELGVAVIADLVGPSEDQLAEMLGPHAGVMARIRPLLRLDGRINQDEVPARIASAHFSLLVRPDKRFARAGFPTKLVESLTVGVPVLSNQTGDIPEYVQDGINGLLLVDSSTEAFVEGVLRALSLSDAQYGAMRHAALDAAKKDFDFRANPIFGAELQALIGPNE